MKKRNLLRTSGILVLVVIMVMMTACLGSGNKDAADGGGASEGETVVLQLTMHDPETSRVGKGMQAWADEVKEKSGGSLEIKVNGSGSLASGPDALDYVKKGSADIGWVYTMFNPGQFTLAEVVAIPMTGFVHPVQTANTLWDLQEEFPELKAELNNGMKLLECYGNPANFLSTVDKPITSLADIKGMPLRAPAGGISDVLALWGANPMAVPAGEVADALQKGTVTGASWEWQGIEAFKLYEHLKYYMDSMTIYDGVFVVVMNQDKYDSLSDDQKKVIDETTGREGSIAFGQLFHDAANDSKEVVLGAGGEQVEVPAAAVAEFQKIADEYAAGWADRVSADKGIDGKAFLARAVELGKKHEVK